MSNLDLSNSPYIIKEEVSLKDAMVSITLNQRGSVIVINNEGLLLGIVSDGDIRRALLQHDTFLVPVSKVLNMNVQSLSNGDSDKIQKASEEIFQRHAEINLIPVIDKRNKVIDIVVRNPGTRKAQPAMEI